MATPLILVPDHEPDWGEVSEWLDTQPDSVPVRLDNIDSRLAILDTKLDRVSDMIERLSGQHK